MRPDRLDAWLASFAALLGSAIGMASGMPLRGVVLVSVPVVMASVLALRPAHVDPQRALAPMLGAAVALAVAWAAVLAMLREPWKQTAWYMSSATPYIVEDPVMHAEGLRRQDQARAMHDAQRWLWRGMLGASAVTGVVLAARARRKASSEA